METPSSSIRRVTRSQTLVAVNNSSNPSISRKVEECNNNDSSKSWLRNGKSQDSVAPKVQDRSALVDITNDSPIVGLAAGNVTTPISSVAKQRRCYPKMMTPGSGEALLRGQVKTLLQKVEEEAEISKISSHTTPANTPEILNLSQAGTFVVAEQFSSKVVGDVDLKKQEESQISNRSLLLDFSENLENWSPSRDDDKSSLWSIQVNASRHGECDDEDEDEGSDEEDEEEEEEEEEEEMEGEDNLLVDELCRRINKISVNEQGKAEEFVGKHTRFVYDSDDEFIQEVNDDRVSPSVLRLKGMPTPKGKHLRFSAEDDQVDTSS